MSLYIISSNVFKLRSKQFLLSVYVIGKNIEGILLSNI